VTNDEHIKWNLADCANSAIDCRDAADYAQHAFNKGNEEAARGHVARLEQNLSRLKAHMAQLDFWHRNDGAS
jgi:hypothetical protein